MHVDVFALTPARQIQAGCQRVKPPLGDDGGRASTSIGASFAPRQCTTSAFENAWR
jgi:hypothetical protein